MICSTYRTEYVASLEILVVETMPLWDVTIFCSQYVKLDTNQRDQIVQTSTTIKDEDHLSLWHAFI